MTESQVRTILGSPLVFQEVTDRSATGFRNQELERKFNHLMVMLYKSTEMGEDDLVVYIDKDHRVVHTERLVYIVRY